MGKKEARIPDTSANNNKRELIEIDQLMKLDRNKFWKEVKRNRKPQILVKAESRLLVEKYKDLFNKENETTYSDHSKEDIKAHIEQIKREITDRKSLVKVTENEVDEIILKIKNGKSVGLSGVSNEMIKYSSSKKATESITKIINDIFTTGRIPGAMNVGRLIPIVKDDKIEPTIDNTRPITISDTITNIFEKVLLNRILRTHQVHDLQFGFKKNSSCNHAVYTLSELSRNLNQKGNRCHVVAIDASKAFDKINRNKLISKLSKVTDPHTWTSLKNYYSGTKIVIDNNGELS